MIDDDVDTLWPAEPTSRRDTRAVAAVNGAYHAVTRRLELSTRDHGLDASEALVLNALSREPACPPWLVRRRTGLHRSTLASILDRLECDDRIERGRSSVDGRRFEIRLTTLGRISADIAELIVLEVEAEIAGYTSPAERRGAVAVFEACLAINRRDRSSYM